MISELLQKLSDDGLITAKQLADCLSLSTSQAYRKLTDSELTHGQFRTLFRWTQTREVKRRLLDSIIGGTDCIATFVDASKDFNGSGVVNTDDVIDATVAACDSVAKTLANVRHVQRKKFSRISAEDARDLHAIIAKAQQELCSASQAIDYLTTPATPSRRTA